jgi:hypothetical protein
VQRRTDNAISRRQVYIRTKSEVTVAGFFFKKETKYKLVLLNIFFKPGEKWAPWCTIRTVTRCDSYLDESICASRYWNMRAEIQDTEAGIKKKTIALREPGSNLFSLLFVRFAVRQHQARWTLSRGGFHNWH